MAYIKLEDLQKIPIRIDHYDKENGNEDFVLGIETAIEYAEHLPTADVEEVKHGEWIMDDFTHQPHCSVCGRVQPYDTVNGYLDYWDCDYCTICGAKMDGGKKG